MAVYSYWSVAVCVDCCSNDNFSDYARERRRATPILQEEAEVYSINLYVYYNIIIYTGRAYHVII